MPDYNSICRACLNTMKSFQYFLFDNVLPDLYRFCTSVEVKRDEAISRALCDTCYDLLTKFNEFKNTCIQSHKTLSNKIKSSHLEIGPLNSDTANQKLKDEHTESNCLAGLRLKNESNSEDDNDNGFPELNDSNYEATTSLQPLIESNKIKARKRSKLKLLKSGKKLLCEICNRRFLGLKRLKTHQMTHEVKAKRAQLKCTPCNKTFLTWCGLKRHNTTWHSVVSLKRLKCRVCGKVARSGDSLRSHEKLHSDRQVHICNVCGKAYSTMFGLKIHLETHQENRERQCTCEYCGKKFFTKKTLSSHVSRCHTGRRFICQICNYPFTDKYNLSQHLLIHEGKKLYKCKVCEKSFATRFSFEEHQRIHSGERPFSCSYCQKSFLSKKRLTEHHRIHTGEKPHKCSVCARGFTQRGTLKRHMKIHDKIVPIAHGKYIEARV